MKYKVIAVGGDEFLTEEFAYQAESEKEAKEIAWKLYKKVDDGNYPDLMVEIYPHYEDIRCPEDDYPVLLKDYDGNLVWQEMRMGTYGRIGIR